MAELIAQFEEAVRNVEPSADDKRNASDAHQEVRDCLSEDPGLNAWGIETVLIGSYKRHVSIRRVKDVDVLSKLPDLPDDVAPDDVLDAVGTALRSCYPSDRVEPQDRSFKVLFPGFDLHVDVVPARIAGPYLEIPDRRGDDADDSERGWVLTNPEELTRLTTKQNEAYEGMYVPIVKLVRQTRRTRIGQGQKPGGFLFEILTYHAFEGGLVGENIPQLYVSSLAATATQLRGVVGGAQIEDPTMPGRNISVRATQDQWERAADLWEQAARDAATALSESDVCEAAKLYRSLLGTNGDGDIVFPMPAACDEDGNRKAIATVTPGDRSLPEGDRDRPFA
jgi:hypothetical protein